MPQVKEPTAKQLLIDLVTLLEATVTDNARIQQIHITTQDEEIADMLCARYNAARKYVLKHRAKTQQKP